MSELQNIHFKLITNIYVYLVQMLMIEKLVVGM